MKVIVITGEAFFADEAARCTQILASGAVDFLHIRKPGASAADTETLLRAIPEKWHEKLALHDHFELAETFAVGGLHLNGRNPLAPPDFGGRISHSCHTISELQAHQPACDYCFLSPVFNSISKKNYAANFSDNELNEAGKAGIVGEKTVALGGVEPSLFSKTKTLGFGGAALLGYVWKAKGEEELSQILNTIKHFKQ